MQEIVRENPIPFELREKMEIKILELLAAQNGYEITEVEITEKKYTVDRIKSNLQGIEKDNLRDGE